MASDNKNAWDSKHASGIADQLAHGAPTEFATEVQKVIPPHAKLLELGCGQGQDAVYFAQNGHDVAATDFSETVIQKNQNRHPEPNLSFSVLDISKPMPFSNNALDVVYASFSLHYFADATTQVIFQELERILKPGGYLCFVCKSTTDFYYGKGVEIEKNVYEFNDQMKHYFSESYTKSLLEKGFELIQLETGEKKFFSYPAGFIKVIAQKKASS